VFFLKQNNIFKSIILSKAENQEAEGMVFDFIRPNQLNTEITEFNCK